MEVCGGFLKSMHQRKQKGCSDEIWIWSALFGR